MATSSDHTKARLALEKLGDVSRKSECAGSVHVSESNGDENEENED